MQIAGRVEFACSGIDRCGDRRCIKLRADERGHIQPQWPIADAADAKRDLEAASPSSSATWAAAATKAKSERRALISKKPTPMRRCGQTGNRIALTHSP